MRDYGYKYWLLAVCTVLYGSWVEPSLALDGSAGTRSSGKSFISVNILPHLDIRTSQTNTSEAQNLNPGEFCIVSNNDGAGYKVQVSSVEGDLKEQNLSLEWITTNGDTVSLVPGLISSNFYGAATASECDKGSNANLVLTSAGLSESLTGSLSFLILAD